MNKDLKEYVKLVLEGLDDDDFEGQEEKRRQRWAAEAARPEVKEILDMINAAQDPKQLAKAKRAAIKADDAGIIQITGVWMAALNAKKKELDNIKADERSLNNPNAAADHRMDTLLRTRDSSGRATPRKF